MKRVRYVIEGTWSGYTSSQIRICHRMVLKLKDTKAYSKLMSEGIRFTDNTYLYITVRKCLPREKIKEINGYGTLIKECLAEGVNAVSDLGKYKKKEGE